MWSFYARKRGFWPLFFVLSLREGNKPLASMCCLDEQPGGAPYLHGVAERRLLLRPLVWGAGYCYLYPAPPCTLQPLSASSGSWRFNLVYLEGVKTSTLLVRLVKLPVTPAEVAPPSTYQRPPRTTEDRPCRGVKGKVCCTQLLVAGS